MNKIANYITNYITNDNNLDPDVVRYGVDAILSTVLCFSCALIGCYILGDIWFGFLFIIAVTPIKMSFKGYHCKTLLQCILTYGCFVCLFLLIYKSIGDYYPNIIVYLIIIICITLLIKSELTRKSGKIIIIYVIIGISFYILHTNVYLIVLLACSFELILLCLLHYQIIAKTDKKDA